MSFNANARAGAGNLSNTGIRPVVLDQIRCHAKRCGIYTVILFGPRARGTFHRDSDIDLAVSGGNVDFFRLAVEEETETLLTYDVVDLDCTSIEVLLDVIRKKEWLSMKKFDNYKSNLAVLSHAGEQDLSNEFIIGGIIDKYSLQFELGWKVLKELLRYEGVAIAATGSPREILKAAYRIYPCMDESIRLGMLAQRNNMAHMYDGEAAAELAGRVINEFIPAFQKLSDGIEEKYRGVLEELG